MLQTESADRVFRRVGHTATDARPVRRGVPVRVGHHPEKVAQDRGGVEELQLADVAGGRQHGDQEARNAPARRKHRVQVDEQAEDRVPYGHTGERDGTYPCIDLEFVLSITAIRFRRLFANPPFQMF